MLNHMKSALGVILGVSVLAAGVGCDGGSDAPANTAGTAGIVVVGGTGSGGTTSVVPGGTGTTAGMGTGGSGGGATAEGVPLTPMMGWVDGLSNVLKIQGAMFSYADDTTKVTMMTDTTQEGKVCIQGTAAKVDLMCVKPPGKDCYGATWGAAIGLNLNQPTVEMDGMMVGGTPMPYDASAIKGFAFTVTGTMLPGPTDFRFKIDDGTEANEFCSVSKTSGTFMAKTIKMGLNEFTFEDLVPACWKPVVGAPTGASIKNKVVKIAWQVVTNDKSTVPFNFCIEGLVAKQ